MPKSNTSSMPLQEAIPTGARPQVSVIIVSWNVRGLLEACLQALFSPEVTGGITTEIIVVDNCSQDGSAEAARKFAGVRVLENERNLGYGPANNRGMEVAHGEYLLILNPDTVMLPGSLQALVGFAQRSLHVGIAAPRLLNPDGTVQPSAFRFPTLTMALLDLFPLPGWVPGRLRKRIYNSKLNGRYDIEQVAKEPYRIEHPLGACMLINAEAYKECGGFDPAIFMYSEEIDIAIRFAEAGWECRQVPQARVVHYGSASTRQLPRRMMVELWRSRFYIYRKYRSRRALRSLALLLLTAQLVHTVGVLVAQRRGIVTRPEAKQRLKLARALSKLALRQL